MAVVKMFIKKFGKEVLIDEDHPLAVLEKERAPTVTHIDALPPRKRKRQQQGEA